MHSPYTSDVFWHMVGYGVLRDNSIPLEDKAEHCYQRLKQIIEFGFIAGADEDGERVRREGNTRLNINPEGHLRNGDFEGFLARGVITCYADIPWGSLGLHTSKYGMFGFGVSAAYLARVGARPVTYIPCIGDGPDWDFRGHALLDSMTTKIIELHSVVDEYEDAHNPEDENGWVTVDNPHQWSGLQNHLMRDVAAFIKPYDARLDITHPECYYSEREWRLLGNVQIAPQKVPVIVVAKGYRDRLLKEAPRAREFKIMELSSSPLQWRVRQILLRWLGA